MGTRSKGRQGVYINMWSTRRERLCDNGAFGQSEYQQIRNHNKRINENQKNESAHSSES